MTKQEFINSCSMNKGADLYFFNIEGGVVIKTDKKKMSSLDFLNEIGCKYEDLIIGVSTESILKYSQCNDMSIERIIEKINNLDTK